MEMINGFQCKTCTDVDYAKKHIDPAHPKDGPYGVNSKDKVERRPFDPAFRLDGQLAQRAGDVAASLPAARALQTGRLVDCFV